MIFEDTLVIQAERERAWEFLLDVKRFSACIPGVQEITQLDHRTFAGALSATVGPLSGTFHFRAEIVDARPRERMVVDLQGTDSVTHSTISADMHLQLTDLDRRSTQLAYRAAVELKGRLAILGDMVLRTTATLLLEEFARRLRTQLETEQEDRFARTL